MRVVVQVLHAKRAKMVGKVFEHNKELIFFHEDTTGTQQHQHLDSPGGIDRCVIEYLASLQVIWIYHHTRTTKTWLRAPLTHWLERPNKYVVAQHAGGRDRLYLSRPHWEVVERARPSIPWITDIITLAEPRMEQAVLF